MVILRTKHGTLTITYGDLKARIESGTASPNDEVLSQEVFGDGNWRVLRDTKVYQSVSGALATTVRAAPDPGDSGRFEGLLGYAKVVVVLGWLTVCLGPAATIVSLSLGGGVFGALLEGFAITLAGLALVATGQFMVCVVAIEKNTRATVALLGQVAGATGK